MLVSTLKAIPGGSTATLVETNEASSGKPVIAIGFGSATASGMARGAASGLGKEGYVVTTAAIHPSGSIVATGGDGAPRGTLYAVNAILHAIGVTVLSQDTTVLPDALPPPFRRRSPA